MTRKIKILAAVAVILLISGAVALGVWLSRDGLVARVDKDAGAIASDAEAVPQDLVRQDQPIYYAFDPPISVNMKDTGGILQAGISVSTHYAAVNDALKNDDPALRSTILTALADADPTTAMTDEGKEQLLSRAKVAINQQLRTDGFKGAVEGAYFTSFIVQTAEDGD